jgi:hypothetical protein
VQREITPADPGLTVLYTSGYPADSILRHGVADATVAYIEKPYLIDELGRKVRELLESRPQPGTSRKPLESLQLLRAVALPPLRPAAFF